MFQPYIFSHKELHCLLKATGSYESPRTQLQGPTFRALLLVLYGAELRISEAISLTRTDVDLSAGLLTIRESKFYKTRLTPIGPQLTEALAQYTNEYRQQRRLSSTSDTFFVTRGGTAVTRSMAEHAFCRLRDIVGIRRDDGARYQPRLHDLRHSMAVHRLVAWYREGADVQRLLPQLSTYLGHVDIKATQRYLTMKPTLLQEASQRFERYAQPEVTHG